MLRNLYIENIAVIEKTSIDFTRGLNVLTGETGAGKSIIIDSINAVLGGRTSRELIRNGCDSAFVSAEFCDLDENTLELVRELGFEPDEDGSVIIQREISQSSKGRCRINDRPATVTSLRTLGSRLINIHGQHETYELMSGNVHLGYIDKLGNLQNELDEYRSAFKEFSRLEAELKKAELDDSERARRIDLLSYQTDEIEKADITVGEYDELLEQRKIIENRENIEASLGQADIALSGAEDTEGALSSLQIAIDSLGDISDVLPDTGEIVNRLQSALYEIEDCRDEIVSLAGSDSENIDPEEIEDRIALIKGLCRKYGPTEEDVLGYYDKAKKELEYLRDYEENREALAANCKNAEAKAKKLALRLSEKRRETGREFSKRVKEEMTFLDMPRVELAVRQDRCPLNSTGCDDIELLISANPGEAPKPVAKIASGGELSRMMLAIKNVLADKDETDTLIFDEVDTGISGRAAQKVGMKLKEVARARQVLCVTHQAQIAGLADTHWKIEKNVIDEKTYTQVNKLDNNGRVQELARIIGGVEITQATLDYARELLGEKP